VAPILGARKRYSIVHVDDLIAGTMAAALDGPPGELYFLSNDEPAVSDALAAAIVRSFGRGRPLARVYVSDGLLKKAAALCAAVGLSEMFNPDKALEMTQRAWVCSAAKARSRIRFGPSIPLEAGLKATAEWYLREGWV
jgi:nucleoside-diphosphate-sugar epimerase